MGLTSDRNDPGLCKIKANGQQEVYIVLSTEERANYNIGKVIMRLVGLYHNSYGCQMVHP